MHMMFMFPSVPLECFAWLDTIRSSPIQMCTYVQFVDGQIVKRKVIVAAEEAEMS